MTTGSRPLHRYEPFGTAYDVIYSRSRELLVVGPAGTGKSRAILEKIHYRSMKYPGHRTLVLRKTRKSITDSALVTFEEHVLPPGDPIKSGAGRDHRQRYTYPNGAEIVLAGLDDDNVDKVMSTEWDLIYIQEAIEVTSEVWEKATIRLRNGKGPYHQIIGDTNPGAPSHWLYKRFYEEEKPSREKLEARHTDNPRLYDGKAKRWTPEGEAYLDTLDALSGALRDRYLKGKWVAQEGARWKDLDERVHCYRFAEKFPNGIPENWSRIVMVDYGLRAPYCALWAAIDEAGDIWLYRERYQPGLKAWQQIEEIIDSTSESERIRVIRMDPAMWQDFPQHEAQTGKSAYDYYLESLTKENTAARAEGRPVRFGPIEKGFNKSRMMGQITIDNLLDRENGRANLWIEKSLCPNLWTELEGAVWADKQQKEDIDEKCPDHAITALIYGVHNETTASAPPKPRPSVDAVAMQEAKRQERIQNEFKDFAKRGPRGGTVRRF